MANFIFTRDPSKDIKNSLKKTIYYAWPEYEINSADIKICWATKTLTPTISSPIYYLINKDNGAYASQSWYTSAIIEPDGIAKRLIPNQSIYIDSVASNIITINVNGQHYRGERDSSLDMDSTIDEVSIKVLYDDYSSPINSISLDGNTISIPGIYTITRGVNHTIEVDATISSPSRIYYNGVIIAEEYGGSTITGTFIANASGEIKISID